MQTTETAVDGRCDFDFLLGKRRGLNRKRVNLLASDSEWIEFEGRNHAYPIVGGLGNAETFEAPDFPGRPGFEGFTLRLFEPETGLWRIWWASSAGNGQLDNPVVGRFLDGVGIFECDDVVDGVPLRVRYTWQGTGSDSSTWEQSFSFDEGSSWDVNWIAEFTQIDETASL
jgi:hypothetical protein